MPSLSPDGEPQRLAATPYTPEDDVYERLKALELQLILEYQRQREQIEEELYKLRDQLVALADEWAAEREAFLAALQTYLATQLSQGPAGQLQPLAPALYDAELAAIGERLSSFLRTLDSTPRYTIQHRVAEYQQTLETQYGAAAADDTARLAAIQPPPEAAARHDAVRQALAIMQHILHLYKELRGQFDFATVRFANRLASHIKYRLYPVRQQVPALLHYWLLDKADVAACEPPAVYVDPDSGI